MNLPPMLAHDKANHFVYGSLAAAVGVLLLSPLGVDPRLSTLGSAALVGLAKEVYDWATGKGTPDGLDALWTAAGGLPAALAAFF